MLVNARSICNKFFDLEHLLFHEYNGNLEIIAIIEICIALKLQIIEIIYHDNSFPYSVTSLYSIFRCDRTNKIGGGVLLLVRNIVPCTTFNLPNFQEIDCVAVTLLLKPTPLVICCVYSPPPNCVASLAELNLLFQSVTNTNAAIIVGDFNFPDIVWSAFPTTNISGSDDFLAAVASNSLYQFVDQPTHTSGNVLDLLFANEQNLIQNVKINPPFSTSDNFCVSFHLHHRCPTFEPTVVAKPNLSRANYAKLNSFFCYLDWSEVFHSCGSVDQAWSVFIGIVQEGIRKFVPHCKPSSRRTIFSKATRKLIYAKHKCYRRLKYSVSLDMTTAVL